MDEPVLLSGFSNMQLVDLHLHISPDTSTASAIEIVAIGGEKKRHLRFTGVSNLRIDEGFSGSISGMEIVDISSQQWDSVRIHVRNFEQDPGITFFAAAMENVSAT